MSGAVFAGDLHAILNPNCGQKQVLVMGRQHANSVQVYWTVPLDCLQILAIPIEEDLFCSGKAKGRTGTPPQHWEPPGGRGPGPASMLAAQLPQLGT